MRKTGFVSFIVMAIVLLAACGEADDHDDHGTGSELNFDPLEVEIIAPEEADPNEEVTIQALVTQGEEKVNDADEVVFEIWQQGEKEDSEFIEAQLTDEEDGVYEIRYTFTAENIYHVQPHVTARGMHMMPTGEIKVGDAPDVHEDEEEHGHEADGHSHDLPDDLRVDWQAAEEVDSGEEAELTVFVDWQEEPLTEARVIYEVWQHGDEAHEWLETEEVEPGIYTSQYTFDNGGDYHVVVHIENDELHEHVSQLIHVIQAE
nr:FixH family protein [Evansella caseinilytica]